MNDVAPADLANGHRTQPDQLLPAIYRLTLIARAVDERLWILSRQGRVSFVLTARGHEVAQVAAALAIRPGFDSSWLYYRDVATGLALGITPYEIFLGAAARAGDPHSGGRQLTTHFSSPRLRIGSISSEIAAHIPHAVGAAYAARVLGEDSVALCSFGDGATSAGATHEAMNLASVRKLPVVFFCQNNGLAISVPQALQMAISSVAHRATAYAMPGLSVDGADGEAVHGVLAEAVARARRGDGPSLIEARVPRMTPHSSQDDELYRTEADRAAAAAADPLPRLRTTLLERGQLDQAEDERLRAEIRRQVIADEDRAFAQPEPELARARRWLYAGDPPHPELAELERGGNGRG